MKKVRGLISFWVMILCILPLTACGGEAEKLQVIINYADAYCFEAALNDGENLEGKIVQFVADDFKPDSALGYNIWAGEHLNFISERNPDVKVGDTVVVKATTIKNNIGSWVIEYEKVDNAVTDDSTIFSDKTGSEGINTDNNNSNGELSEKTESLDYEGTDALDAASDGNGTTSFSVGDSKTEQPLELVDYGWYINPPSGDTAYVEFCGMVYNPNENLVAEFPEVLVTVKNGDGSILATEEQMGSIVMPKDTVTLCGSFSLPISDLTDDAQIKFDVDWSDLKSGASIYSAAKTTDFTITNVSERNNNNENFITGEITNNYTQEIDQINLSIVLRKDDKIVYMENTFLDNLKVGKAKAFEFQRYSEYPDHDTIDVSAMVW